MASGVTVSSNAMDAIQQMRIPKEKDDRLRLITFKFKDINGKEQIDVDEKVFQSQLDECNLDAFSYMKKNMLQEQDCNYVLYDWQYDTKETSLKKELVFIMWCHESSAIGKRMKFASSRLAIKEKMEGVKHDAQLTDYSEVSSKKAFAEHFGKCNLVSMEGEIF